MIVPLSHRSVAIVALALVLSACTGGIATAPDATRQPESSAPSGPSGIGGAVATLQPPPVATGPLAPGAIPPGGEGPGPGDPLPPPVQPGAAGGPPGWVTVGTRLTWYVAGASVAQGRFAMVPDPTCNDQQVGCYFVKAEGIWYRKTDEGVAPQDQPTASGDGFVQIDVTGIDGGRVALMSNAYVVDRTFGQLLATPIGGAVLNSGQSVEGLWVHPDDLARAAEAGTFGGQMVATGRYQIGDQVVPSISFVTGLGTGNYQSYTYDSQSGVLLSSNGSFGGASQNWILNGQPATAAGNMQLGMSRLVGVRERTLPGRALPDWVAGTSELAYSGNFNFTNPVDPTSANLDYPMEQRVALGQRGANWAAYAARSVVSGAGLDNTFHGVEGPAGLYWQDPAALAAMVTGQLLDGDPVTNERVSVAYAGPANGGNVVVIDSLLPGVATRATYDMSGMLVAWEGRFASTGTTITLQLVSWR